MQISKLQLSSNSLLNWLLQGKDSSKDLPRYTKAMFFDHLYEVFKNTKKHILENSINLSKFNSVDYEANFEFLQFYDKLQECSYLFSYFLMHGSYADLQIKKGWSDFDSIAVIKKESLVSHNRNKLFECCQELDFYMRKIDEFQHHGIHFIHENELSSYPNLYLPINLFEDSKCLLGNKSLNYNCLDSYEFEKLRYEGIIQTLKKAGNTGILMHHGKNGKYLLENYKDTDTMYQLKYFLSVIMLLPTLFLNLKGNYCRKSDSFTLINEYFAQDRLELITTASKIRNDWPAKQGRKINSNRIPTWLVKDLGRDYLKRGADLAKLFEGQI